MSQAFSLDDLNMTAIAPRRNNPGRTIIVPSRKLQLHCSDSRLFPIIPDRQFPDAKGVIHTSPWATPWVSVCPTHRQALKARFIGHPRGILENPPTQAL